MKLLAKFELLRKLKYLKKLSITKVKFRVKYYEFSKLPS